jgi:hypothetical protein
MSKAVGTEIKAAVRKASVWGTAKACGANHGLLILPSNIKKDRASIPDDSLGNYWPPDSDIGEIKAEGDIQAYGRYDGLDALIAMAMGTSAIAYTAPSVSGTATGGSTSTLVDSGKAWTPDAYIGKYVKITGGTGIGQVRRITDNDATTLTIDTADGNWTAPDATSTYEIFNAYATHTYDLADSLDALFLTFCIYNQINVEEAASLKPTGFTIKGEVGKPLDITFNCIAIDKITNSEVNTSVTFANVTFRETANRVLYSQGVIRMNAQDGADFGDGDKIYPKSFELSFKRKMAGMYGVGGAFDKIDEPTNDGQPEVKLKLEFPRYTAATYFTDWDADNAKKLDITFTGAGSRSFKLQFPNLKFASVDLPIEAGILKHPVEFNCLSCAVAPTGMTGVTKPFRATLVNTYGGDPVQVGN